MDTRMFSKTKMLRESIFFMCYRSTETQQEKNKDKIDFSKKELNKKCRRKQQLQTVWSGNSAVLLVKQLPIWEQV